MRLTLSFILLAAALTAHAQNAERIEVSPATKAGDIHFAHVNYLNGRHGQAPSDIAARLCGGLRHEGLSGWSLPTTAQASALDAGGQFAQFNGRYDAVWVSEIEQQDKGPQNYTWNLNTHRQVAVWQSANFAVLCVTDGRTKAGAGAAVAKEGPRNEAPKSSTPINLPGPLLTARDNGDKPTAEQHAATQRAQQADRTRRAEEAAERKTRDAENRAATKARDDSARAACMKPEARGSCACTRFYPQDKAKACTK